MFTILQKYFSPFVRSNEELSLLQIFKPLYVIVSTLGLFPLCIEFPDGKNNFTILFKFATIHLACTLFVPVVIFIFFTLHMLQLSVADGLNTFTTNDLAKTNYNIQLATQLLVSTIVFICAYLYKSLYIKILNGIAECWAKLPNDTNSGHTILGRLRVQINCAVLGSLLIALITQFAVTCTENVTAWKKILLFLTFVLPELVQFMLVAFYFVMILMVDALLKNIEEHFKILFQIGLIRSMGNNYVEAGSRLLPASLCQLRSAYARALAVKRQINAAFQAPLLLVLAQSFHTLVSNAHTLYHGLVFRNDFNIHDFLECSSWSLYQIIKFYAIGHSGALLKHQANKIGRALYDIPASANEDIALHLEFYYKGNKIKVVASNLIRRLNSETDTIRENILRRIIQHFSTLMTFHDTEINLHGFFPLEASLVFNVLASSATYLVILVQFDTAN